MAAEVRALRWRWRAMSMGRAAAIVAMLCMGMWKGIRSDAAVALRFRRMWQRNMGAVVRREGAGVAWMWWCGTGAVMRGRGHVREKKKRMCGPHHQIEKI